LEEIFESKNIPDPLYVIDFKLKPHLDNMQKILMEEDANLIRQNLQGTIGECMEYAIANNIFMEVIALAQSDYPQGMFVPCLDFIIELASHIQSMPIIHNDKMHKSLLQVNKLILSYIKNDMLDINDPDSLNEQVRTILDFMKMLTHLSLDRNAEIAKFFIEEASQYARSRGTQTYVTQQILLEFFKKV